MKLKRLEINGFKNINNLNIDFSANNGTTLFIGNNGCGKSNILEAISSIFAGLYKDRTHKPRFDYHIEYEINKSEIDVSLKNGKYSFIVNSLSIPKSEFTRNSEQYLPTNVISCYSGESSRLWGSYYYPYYKDYLQKIKTSVSVPKLPLIYINKFSLEIALLTLFFYDHNVYGDIGSFCSDVLDIKKINSVVFSFDSNKSKEWLDNPIIYMVKTLSQVDDIADVPIMKKLTIDEIKNNLSYLESNQRQFFYYLYGATMPKEDKIITDIKFKIELNNGSNISIDDFSEGEKKNLLIKFILETVADENSLILFDEPDSHIHISRKAELKETLDKYSNRENLWTTHSPTLAATFDDNNVFGITKDEKGNTVLIDKDKASLVSELTNGLWNIHQQNVFLSSNKPIVLLVEGKTDKVHLTEAFKRLNGDYKELDFDIFSMNSSEHIREVLIGLSCSEIEWTKKFIGIFDNDNAGKKDINNGFAKENSNNEIMHVQYKNKKTSNCFYAFLLPKPNGYDEKQDCTIENMYPSSKYEEALEQAFQDKKGHFNSLSIDKVATDLKNKSKTILSDNAKEYTDSDFESFNKIFALIQEINKL